MPSTADAIRFVRRAGRSLAANLSSPGPAIEFASTPPESVSTASGLMDMATNMAAAFRGAANYRQQRSDAQSRLAYIDAQTRLMESKIAAPETTYSLTTPEREVAGAPLMDGQFGPPAPQTVPGQTMTFTDPKEYSQELARWYPPEKGAAEMTEYQRQSLAARSRLAAVAERNAATNAARAAAASGSRSRIAALNASGKAIDGESAAGVSQSSNNAEQMAAALVQTIAGTRIGPDGRPQRVPTADRKRAAVELGVDMRATPAVVAAAAKSWAARKSGAWGGEVRGRNEARLAKVRQAIYDEAGVDFGAADGSDLIEALRALDDE